MSLLLLAPAAFVAGVLMFLAPCTLPIVPGYLVFIAGTPAGDARASRRKILANAMAFSLGFSAIFILFGLFAGALGAVIGPWREVLGRLSGVLLIMFGLTMLGLLRLPGLGKEWHARLPAFLTIGQISSSFLIGALFAIGWSPCIGPILGTVLLLASASATALQGAFLLAVFSLGLTVPFLLTALLIDAAATQFSKWGRVITLFSRLGAILLIVVGLAIVFGCMGVLTSWGYSLFELLGYNRLYQYL